MLPLPTELYSLIFRLATCVPEAWDTSFEAVKEEHRDRLIQRIHDSARTKVAISTSSKAFHSIMELFLYETVIIYRFQVIPNILRLLRSVPNGYLRPRGHTCRRLDIYLGVRNRQVYLDEAWDDGGHILWGLLHACPRLEVLVARVMYTGPDINKCFVPHHTHSALWKTISTYCASTLRRLELFGFSLFIDQLETMLRYMVKLEACDVSHCEPVQDVNAFDPHFSGQWEPRTYDEEEPTQVTGRWFDDDIQAEFIDAKTHAVWPPFTGDPLPYLVPKLHSLSIDIFNERFFELRLPILRSLRTQTIPCHNTLFSTNIVFERQYMDSPVSPILRLASSDLSIIEYRNNYYNNPVPHSTPFGLFPKTITHLAMDNWICFQKILYFFPNITDLTCYVELPTWDRMPFWKPHGALQRITIVVWDRFGHYQSSSLQKVMDAVRDGWLLCLNEIVVGYQSKMEEGDPLPFEELEELGIRLSIRDMDEATLTNPDLFE